MKQLSVLLVDDQPIIGRTVFDMLETASDIRLSFSDDPFKVFALARELTPDVILQDLHMPGIDGLRLLSEIKGDREMKDAPVIILSNNAETNIKAQAFERGASDYLVKLPGRAELVARIRHHAAAYHDKLHRNSVLDRIKTRQQYLIHDLAEASRYVKKLLPPPLTIGAIHANWRFEPSGSLGGDGFGYGWLDDRHFAFYLLDVSGHGTRSSLLCVSILNMLSHHTLPSTDFHDPSAVMRALNEAFQLEENDGHYFTIWYGVYDSRKRQLCFSGAGHPPPILFSGTGRTSYTLDQLFVESPPIGVIGTTRFENKRISVPTFGRVLLYTDGAVELPQTNGDLADESSFIDFVRTMGPCDALLDDIVKRARRPRRHPHRLDDCTVMEVDFR
jgi:sigma-B regulation protein RsbU (phosphoserine phosphatase)